MAKITSSDLLLWMQTYVRAVFADRLQKEGFVSMNGDDICWHRIVNQEIINTVFFYTLWSTYPAAPCGSMCKPTAHWTRSSCSAGCGSCA